MIFNYIFSSLQHYSFSEMSSRITGFSVGDELGLPESISNLEGNKRRSLSDRDALAAANSIGTVPAIRLPVSGMHSMVSVLGGFVDQERYGWFQGVIIITLHRYKWHCIQINLA